MRQETIDKYKPAIARVNRGEAVSAVAKDLGINKSSIFTAINRLKSSPAKRAYKKQQPKITSFTLPDKSPLPFSIQGDPEAIARFIKEISRG